jgi:hypothetical protein
LPTGIKSFLRAFFQKSATFLLGFSLAPHSKLININRALAGADFCDFHRFVGFARG